MRRIAIITAVVILCLIGTLAESREKGKDALLRQKAFKKASQYAQTISCEAILDPKKLVTLVPWDDYHDMLNARYALIWLGDIGCYGGSGSSQPHIIVVGIGMAGNFVVFPELSSPLVKFEPSVRLVDSVVKATENELTLRGKDWAPDDALCCPSIPVQIVMRRDEKNGWKLVEKKRVGP